jgi:methylmalonyl-CoA epimerase
MLSGDTPINFVDHVGIAVHDTRAALRHYTDRLGLRLVGDEEAAEPGVRLTYLDAGNTFLQLVQPLRDGPVAAFLRESGEGLHHVCLNVDHIDRALQQLGATSPAGVFRGGRGRRACFLAEEPNGVLLELAERDRRP